MRFSILCAAAAALYGACCFAGPKAPRLCVATQPKCIASVAGAEASASASADGAPKFNPGHYMAPYPLESHSALLHRAKEICEEPALKGMELRVMWSELEPRESQYEFADVEQIYDRLAACRKRLMLQVWHASFDSDLKGFVPDYLDDLVARTNKGFIAKLWDPRVMTRLIALYRALGERFDKEPYFEGIVFTETATGGAEGDYSPEGFIEELTRGVKEIKAAWPTSTVIVFNNFLQSATVEQQAAFMETLYETGAATGGPDVLPPPHDGTLGEQLYRGEVGGRDYRGRMVSAFAVQAPELGGSEGDFTPRELYEHCTGANKCRYMFWTRNTKVGGPEQRWETGILPFLRRNPGL